MLRCNESAGNFIVTMLHSGDEERRQQLNVHAPTFKVVEVNGIEIVDYSEILEEQPIFSSTTPFHGELCVHEVEQLKAPFKYISPELFFQLQAVA